jgi:hypothetical protein
VQQVVISGAQARWGNEVNISNVVGLPYGQIMGYTYQRDSRGDIVFGDNGEPKQTGVVPLGSGMYKWTGGLSQTFRYKKFKLDFLFDYKFGAKLYSQTNLLLYYYGLQKTIFPGHLGRRQRPHRRGIRLRRQFHKAALPVLGIHHTRLEEIPRQGNKRLHCRPQPGNPPQTHPEHRPGVQPQRHQWTGARALRVPRGTQLRFQPEREILKNPLNFRYNRGTTLH